MLKALNSAIEKGKSAPFIEPFIQFLTLEKKKRNQKNL